MTTTDSIAAAIAQAQAGAAAIAQSQSLATQPAGSNAVSTAVSAGNPLGLDDLLGNGVSVDHWLKLTQFGITVGDKTRPLDTIEVFIDMSEIAYSFQVKYQMNGKAVYHRTYDRALDTQGQPWVETLRKAQQIDPKAYEYRSAEVPLIAAVAIEGKEKGTTAAEAGQRLGLTLSTTGWKQFETWVRELARKNIDPKSAYLKLTLGFEERKKEGVNPWGVPTFLKYEEVEALPIFETVH